MRMLWVLAILTCVVMSWGRCHPHFLRIAHLEPVFIAFLRVHLFFGEVSVGVFGPLFKICSLAVGLSECSCVSGASPSSAVSLVLPWPVACLLMTPAFTGRPCLGLVRSSSPSSHRPCFGAGPGKSSLGPGHLGLPRVLFQGSLVRLLLWVYGSLGAVCEGTRSVSRFIFPV